jgi:NAD(P)-dependent dehydrogenase (short-subunit alcohol dehydrogenase family)
MTVPYAVLGLAAGALLARATRPPAGSFHGRVALISGGTRGLGLQLARELGGRGAAVAICGREADTLVRARHDLERRGIDVLAVRGDASDPGVADAVVRAVLERWGALDVVVNCAGAITVGPLATLTREDFDEAMRVNFWAAVHVSLAALPAMRERGQGRIVNISSIGGLIALPHLLPYSASKFAIGGFSEGLAAEARAWGIRVTTVYPGLMRTGGPRHALFKGRHRAEYAWFSIADSLPGLSMHVERAARRIADACHRGDPWLMLTGPARVAAALHDLLPGTAIRLLAFVNRLLPGPGGIGRRAARGHQSESAWAPSLLTAPGERAARRQNQV